MSELTVDELKEQLKFDPDTGCFTWITGKQIGQIAGTTATRGGYRKICLNYQRYSAHHLAWLYIYGVLPKQRLDHIDGNRDNNCIANLREADPSQSRMNISIGRNNTSGVKGVRWSKDRKKWLVTVQAYGVVHRIGFFTDLKDAAAARESAAKRIHGDFARHSVANHLAGV